MLYLFDLDGTLIEGFLTEDPCPVCEGEGAIREPDGRLGAGCPACHARGYVFGDPLPYERVVLLPHRREKLDELRAAGHVIQIVTNQGGVAFGHQTETEVNEKLYRALTDLGMRPEHEGDYSVYVCLGHPDATIERYRADAARRKPSPSMILEAMQEWGYAPGETVFVGDLPTDKQAAEAADVTYYDAEEFFK